ncbi:TIGR00730 family Rossman fold protein [Saccharopolyspora sp. K220]|uniref:LOG family protein n=1 Tax=Saccharopolyspora soli TaxID=2926618 RepID=UPI001F59E6A5|nr:TIGR00730 family Rossman fold protein [Saccharopolyspora soli]MCI2417711.1 TIGR00730 family Rossman fold protein [Saccharopolyspora soli]
MSSADFAPEGSTGELNTATVSVCVFCASGPVPQHYLDLAAQVGAKIAKRGWTLVSGGGRVSMMGEVARAARAGEGRTVGVIPRALVDREVADHDSDELLVVDTMRERKGLMDAHATAFLTLPGGIGTCEEFFEIWTARYIGMHRKPVVLLDPDGHYRVLLDWLHGLVDSGFATQHSLDVLTVATDVDEALDACAP